MPAKVKCSCCGREIDIEESYLCEYCGAVICHHCINFDNADNIICDDCKYLDDLSIAEHRDETFWM